MLKYSGTNPYVTLIKTTVYDAGGNNDGRLDPDETANLTSTLKNIGGQNFSDLTTTINSSDPYITIIDNSGYFGTLKIDSTKENTGDKYELKVSASAPNGHAALFTLITSDGSFADTCQFTLTIGSYDYLVWNPDPTPAPGLKVDSILEYLGYGGVYSTILPSDLGVYEAVFACCGIFSSNYVIARGSAEANALVAYLNSGGRMYMEGGDIWYYDPSSSGYDFGPLFGLDGIADGTGDLGPVVGENGTFTRSMSFAYGGENGYIDHLSPVGTGFVVFRDGDNAYNCGVANNPGTYRTVGTSFELGGLIDAIPPSTRKALLDSIMNFFQVYPTDVVPPTAPHVKKVTKSGNNAVLTWNKVTTDTLGESETMDYYVVYRNTSPSFVPGSSDSIGVVMHPDTVYTDVNVLATASSYYYLIKGVDLQDNRSKNSNMAYVFKKFVNENAATTDRNWVSLPWDNNYATVSALTSDLSATGNPLVKVTNLRNDQLYESWLWDPDFSEWYGTDFAITSGRGYEMVTVLDDTVVLVGCNDPAGLVSLNENPATTDRNWVSIPYNHAYSTVSAITTEYSPAGNPLVKLTNLRDDNLYESWLWDPDFGEWYGTNFAIERGRGYEMVTIVDTVWDPTEYSNESGLFFARPSWQTDMRVRLGTAKTTDRAPVWLEDKNVDTDATSVERRGQRARGIGQSVGDVSHIVRVHVDMKDIEGLVFTAYCPDNPSDVLTENMVGSGSAEKSSSAALWFDAGNFEESWVDKKEVLLIVEATKQGRGYCAVTSLVLDRTLDVEDFGTISLVPISDLNPDDKNIIGYSVYKGDKRLNTRVLTAKSERLDNDIVIRPVFRGGYETVYGSCGAQSSRHEPVSLSYGCDITPNPCVEQVHIDYALPQVSFVELMVYDICGRHLRTLVSEQKEAGYYSVIWDGTDNAGTRVSSGVYFLRFNAGSYTRTKKLLIPK